MNGLTPVCPEATAALTEAWGALQAGDRVFAECLLGMAETALGTAEISQAAREYWEREFGAVRAALPAVSERRAA